MTIIDQTIQQLMDAAVTAAPRILTAILFFIAAAVGIRIATRSLKQVLKRTPTGENEVYRAFAATVFRIFAWFGATLALLSILGLEEIAAAFGTATGFIALGVAYAVKDMLADAVAGVYLLRDPDFNAGDKVSIGGSEIGTVKQIELRKTRFTKENGDTVIKGNAKIEGEWTRVTPADAPATDEETGKA